MRSYWFILDEGSIHQLFDDEDGTFCNTLNYVFVIPPEKDVAFACIQDCEELLIEHEFTLYKTLSELALVIEG